MSHYDVFIVDEPNTRFTTAEKQAMIRFVQNGGGLFMISDHTLSDRNNDGWDLPAIWNDYMTNNGLVNNPFGISFDLADFSETSTNVASASDSMITGPMGTASGLIWYNGTSMTLSPSVNSSVKGVLYKTGSSFGNTNVMAAHARYGQGKVAAIGDSSPCDDGTGSSGHNLFSSYNVDLSASPRKLLMNTTIWLATKATVTGINPIESESPLFEIGPDYPGSRQINLIYTLTQPAATEWMVVSATGAVMMHARTGMQWPGRIQLPVSLSHLASGVYFITVKTGAQQYTRKISVF